MILNISKSAEAHIKGGKDFPKISGIVTFKETKNGVLLTAKIYNLPQNKDKCTGRFFGFHIHDGTSCTGNLDDEFANSKMHYNPNNCPHPFHAGDLPVLIENNGFAYMSVLINKFKIKEIIGKVIIIHEMPDDFTSQPSRKFRKKDCLWKNSLNSKKDSMYN